MMISIILKVLLWIFIGLISLILFLVIYPIFYKAEIRFHSLSYQGMSFVISLSILSFILRIEFEKEGEELQSQIKILRIRVSKKVGFDSGNIEKKEDEKIIRENPEEEKKQASDYDKNLNVFMRFFYKIKNKIESLFDLYHKLKTKKELYLKLYHTDSFTRAINRVKTILPKVLKHLLPRKIKGRIRMGFDSCDKTGMIFGYYSLVNTYFLYDVEVLPDFEQEVFEGKIRIKGRIIPLYLIYQGARLLCNKDVRLTYRRFKKINRR